jgi:MarR family transcriptional regulator for hemolysin
MASKRRTTALSKANPRARALMQIGVSLPVLTRAYKAAADHAVAHVGVSQALAWPLVMLGRQGGPVRPGILAERLGIEAPSLARSIDQLVAGGFVTRADDPDDRRARLVDLTPQGVSACQQIEHDLIALREQLFAGVSDEDLAACLRVFACLQERLGCAKPVMPVLAGEAQD